MRQFCLYVEIMLKHMNNSASVRPSIHGVWYRKSRNCGAMSEGRPPNPLGAGGRRKASGGKPASIPQYPTVFKGCQNSSCRICRLFHTHSDQAQPCFYTCRIRVRWGLAGSNTLQLSRLSRLLLHWPARNPAIKQRQDLYTKCADLKLK